MSTRDLRTTRDSTTAAPRQRRCGTGSHLPTTYVCRSIRPEAAIGRFRTCSVGLRTPCPPSCVAGRRTCVWIYPPGRRTTSRCKLEFGWRQPRASPHRRATAARDHVELELGRLRQPTHRCRRRQRHGLVQSVGLRVRLWSGASEDRQRGRERIHLDQWVLRFGRADAVACHRQQSTVGPLGRGRAATLFTGGRASLSVLVSGFSPATGEFSSAMAEGVVTLRGAH